MNKVKTAITRIIGCLEIALACSFIFGGMITFAIKMMFSADLSVNVFVVLFIMFLCLLLACVGLYSVNPTLWNEVHEKRDDLLLFRMIPDIRVIVELVDYMTEHDID